MLTITKRTMKFVKSFHAMSYLVNINNADRMFICQKDNLTAFARLLGEHSSIKLVLVE